jgi:RimJ/RimL family protein N-acetyltransferase
MNLLKIKIKTERTIIKPISYDFTEEISREYIPKSNECIKKSQQMIKESLDGIKNGNKLQMVIVSKDTNEFIGLIGLHEINTMEPFVEIWIKKVSRKMGYGLEAQNGLLEWADMNIEFKNIYYSLRKKTIVKRKTSGDDISKPKKGYKILGKYLNKSKLN